MWKKNEIFYLLDGLADRLETTPLVVILSFTIDNTKTFEDIDDVIDSSSLNIFWQVNKKFFFKNYTELFGHSVKGNDAVIDSSEHGKESFTEFAEAFFLSVVVDIGRSLVFDLFDADTKKEI